MFIILYWADFTEPNVLRVPMLPLVSESHSFFRLDDISHRMHRPHSAFPFSVDGHVGCVYFLSILVLFDVSVSTGCGVPRDLSSSSVKLKSSPQGAYL